MSKTSSSDKGLTIAPLFGGYDDCAFFFRHEECFADG